MEKAEGDGRSVSDRTNRRAALILSTRTMLLGASGSLLFWSLNLPLPFLLGPISACLLAALAGIPMRGAGQAEQLMRTVLGVAVGSAITPSLIGDLPAMATSILLVVPYLLLIGLIGFPFFHRVRGLDRPTAFYASMPGGFQDMVLFGEEAGADTRALSLIHATRLLVIMVLVPLALQMGFGRSLNAPLGQAAANIALSELALMAVAAIVGWRVARRIGMFGASILGPMIATAALSLAGLITHRPPAEAIILSQLVIGTGIGVKYRGLTLAELRSHVGAGAMFSAMLCLVAAIFALLSHLISGTAGVEALLSFAPGGQAEMAILAIISGADLAFVVSHHIFRVTLVILCAPIVARLIRR